ncbi:MAG: SRPBCC family protein [Candidatus Bacteroides intestinipullorum]|uniref:SRPBCC family protein n=1 Tax=Candidatus Bacteroides intestinipullorum TaxID=2838471 RepID=A0A9E2KF71_9BACE|nr:SRPBCC family protein [Candidatus Bacteroides intestinipullorum]
MTTFESTIKQVQASQKAVYAKLSDLNNLAKVKDRLPEHKVKNMTFDTDTLSMQAPPIGTITLKIVAREPESCITFGTTSSPLPFDLQIHISPVSETESQLQLVINMEVNPFIKNMIQRPLQDGLEKMADLLAMIPYTEND